MRVGIDGSGQRCRAALDELSSADGTAEAVPILGDATGQPVALSRGGRVDATPAGVALPRGARVDSCKRYHRGGITFGPVAH